MTIKVYNSLVMSIAIQITTAIIEFFSLFVKVSPQNYIVKQLLIVDIVVQFIEASFYVYWFNNFNKIKDITPTRYIDWVITTPTMLFTLVMYLIYLQYKEQKEKEKNKDKDKENQNPNLETLNLFDLSYKHSNSLLNIILLNWLMLLCGYLVEIKVLPVYLGIIMGFIPFILYYYKIYKQYASKSKNGFKLFSYFVVIWGLYGFSALMPYNLKNTLYNSLDLFSKNFFGLFLSYILVKNR